MALEYARELRQQGIAAAKAGNKDEARHLLQQSIRLDSNNEAAWLWLASVARDNKERRFCLEKLLEINPNNDTARKALEGMGPAPASAPPPLAPKPSGIRRLAEAPGTPSMAPRRRSSKLSTQEMMSQVPGVPAPTPESIAEAQQQVEPLLRAYMAPPPDEVAWTHKQRRRAGERDIVYLRMSIAAAVAGILILIFAVGTIIVLTNDDLRGIVIAPTSTATYTPTVTPTNTPGFTPTPSPTPRVTLTPSPTVPASVPTADVYNLDPTAIFPPVLEKPLQDSVAALDRGEAAAAIPTLQAERDALTRFNPNPYYYLALAQLQRGDADDALETLEEAESRLGEAPNENHKPLIDAGYAQVYWQLAQQESAAGRDRQAREHLDALQERAEAAIEREPRLAQPYLYLARVLTLDGDFTEAISVLDQGLGVPQLASNVDLLVEKGETYYQQGEYDLADYQAYVAHYIDPTVERAYQLQIRTALAQDRPGQAVLYAQDYLLYYPGSALAYKLLGDARLAEGNPHLALTAYTQALAGDVVTDATVDALIARAAIYMDERRFSLAREDLTRAYDLSDDRAVQALRMQAAYADGRLQIALSDADELLGRNVLPDKEIQLLRARILVDQAGPDDEAAYQQAVSLLTQVKAAPVVDEDSDTPAEPALPQALIPIADEYLARAQLALGNETAAMNAVESALTAQETIYRRYLRGQIAEAAGDDDEAVREYEWVLTWSGVFDVPFRVDALERLEALREA